MTSSPTQKIGTIASFFAAFGAALILSTAACLASETAGDPANSASLAASAGLTGRSALISQTYLYSSDSETYETYGTGTIRTVTLGEADKAKYPALAASLDAYAAQTRTDMTDRFNEYCEWSRTALAEGGASFRASVETDIRMRRFDDEVFSYVFNYSDYSGGAHGYYSFIGHNYDTQTGAEIILYEVVNDEQRLRSIVLEKLKERYGDYLEPDLDSILANYAMEGGEYIFNWVMQPDGIAIMFNPYEIAPYASGAQHVEIGFSEYPDLFTQKYHAQQGAYAYQLDTWLDNKIDLNGDNEYEDFTITWEYEDYESYGGDMEYAGKVSIGVQKGQASCKLDDVWFYDMSPVLMHTADGRNYLYVDLSSENDYHMIQIFDLNQASPFWVGSVDAGFSGHWSDAINAYCTEIPMDPQSFPLQTRMQVLSTYDGERIYSLDEKGMAVTQDPFYLAHSSFPMTLKVSRELPVAFVEATGPQDAGAVTGTGTVPVGEELTIWRTDSKTIADLKRADGSIVRVKYDHVGWPRTIAGEDENLFFEMLYYAG